jgi:methylated-DNA-[protein]-cysteine S-methyltransferase
MTHSSKVIDSPVGKLTLVARADRLAAILWEDDRDGRVRLGSMADGDRHPALLATAIQLGEYFRGARTRFDLPLDFAGTDFQKQVWAALLTIPFGETRTYAQIAAHIGNVKAVRAVGAANGRNPISIVAPCHRVIGSDGSLTGFAGGLDIKEKLLALEGVALRGRPPAHRAASFQAELFRTPVDADQKSTRWPEMLFKH